MKADDLRRARDFDLVACAAPGGAASSVWTTPPEHVGVWLERCYLGETDKEKPVRRELYQRAIAALRVGAPAFETWRAHFERVRRDLTANVASRHAVVVEAKGRVLLHPASNGSVTDGAVLMHHTYGVPYLPGSGLKGVARAWMRRAVDLDERSRRKAELGDRWDSTRSDARDQEIVRALFGSIPREGDEEKELAIGSSVEFLDALWVPEAPKDATGDWSPLSLDVINPHQSDYYTGDAAPGDTNEPVPTHRLTVSPGARFLVVVEGVTREADAWAKYALERLLVPALANAGFGAWTSAGYGRFAVVEESTRDKPAGRPTQPAVVEGDWHAVTLKLDPGPGTLIAALPGPTTRVAEAIGARAKALRETLSPELQERLKKKRELKAQVRVKLNGRAIEIVEIKA